MVHLRIVSPAHSTREAMDLLTNSHSVCNVILLEGAARQPVGDVILCDVAREDASVVLSDLKGLEIHKEGSIALEVVDTEISAFADEAEKRAEGSSQDAVVWEEVEQRTSENVELSGVFLAFMVLAGLIAAIGIFLNSAILIVGAMVVGPEFGPMAGFCVAVVQRRWRLAIRSAVALAVGFPLAITVVWLATLLFQATGLTPEQFTSSDHQLSRVIASPDFFAAFVAACAGIAGVLSLSTAKSGALIGVVISVTTIPAAANIGISFAYQDWPAWRGSMGQLAINLVAILAAGSITLLVQRMLYHRRKLRHLEELGLPSRSSPRTMLGNAPARAKQAARERAAKV